MEYSRLPRRRAFGCPPRSVRRLRRAGGCPHGRGRNRRAGHKRSRQALSRHRTPTGTLSPRRVLFGDAMVKIYRQKFGDTVCFSGRRQMLPYVTRLVGIEDGRSDQNAIPRYLALYPGSRYEATVAFDDGATLAADGTGRNVDPGRRKAIAGKLLQTGQAILNCSEAVSASLQSSASAIRSAAIHERQEVPQTPDAQHFSN